ncbi:hypothetical protein K457DRAFT_28997 [Linnemannia elongata AG-77]|uniref:AA1-like domain-containing protein n=1 Tax=Linnemannia elongata AG-77 TaxID=1314771 RepID=A0A197KBR6_9FUNG|nr:hypothetical protein K457DRAFT_28997 [Linnemannia elongata AG-77]
MLKSTSLLALAALSVYVAMAEANIAFWEHMRQGGRIISCPRALKFNICHRVSNIDAGLSSYMFWTNESKKDFSVTLYTGDSCSGTYDRWSFSLDPAKDEYGFFVEEFATVNDKVQSFKMADFHTSFVKGGYWPTADEDVYTNECQFGWPSGYSSKVPPMSNVIRG